MAKILFNVFTGNFDYVEQVKDVHRIGVSLIGAINGVNKDFITPEKFTVVDGLVDIAVYYNGSRWHRGASSDFTISESGGLGTGYDTIHLAIAPLPSGATEDVLLADYVKR